MGKEAAAPLPSVIVIEPSTRCNLRCSYCAVGQGLTRRRADLLMPWHLFERVADQIEPFAKHVYLTFLGESTLHPRLPDMIARINEFATIDLATNGIVVDRELAQHIAKCDTVSVTISGLYDMYAYMHGAGLFYQAMDGLINIVDAGAPRLSWTWVVTSANEHQIEEARELAEQIGVTLRPKSCAFGARDRKTLMSKQDRYNRYTKEGTLKYDRSQCRVFSQAAYILVTGDIVPCGYDYAGLWSPGNLRDRDFLEVWNSEQYEKWRSDQAQGKVMQLCRLLCGEPQRRKA